MQTFTDELAAMPALTALSMRSSCIGAPRKIDFKAMGVDYPNYGASPAEYPVDTGRLRHVIEQVAETVGMGQREVWQRRWATVSPPIAAS